MKKNPIIIMTVCGKAKKNPGRVGDFGGKAWVGVGPLNQLDN